MSHENEIVSIPDLSNLPKISHENEILSKAGLDWTPTLPTHPRPDPL